ncbi:MAG: hypothetical protein O3C63_00110 [Cyanobacteria bacterium]|nr:hypothetical protein [Cyanobacteriota bacterium]MDA1020524.1 hypothetical protein [Cyanobacteriota bacterium]
MNYIIYLLLVLVVLNPALARRIKGIPSPVINQIDKPLSSPNTIIELQGQGFIKGMPNAHKVILTNNEQKIKAQVIKANGDMLRLQIPPELSYGDFDIYVQIKTRLLKSKRSKSSEPLLLRPVAPAKPDLNYQTIQHQSELDYIYNNDNELDYELLDEIKIGENKIQSFYYQDGFQSIKSEPSNFYYLPELAIENQLEINSELPIESFAVNKFLGTKYDVSPVTNTELNELSRHYYLKTPSRERYLEYSIELSPVFIEQIHVTEPEYALIKNRSSTDFDLSNCNFADSIRDRYQFTNETIPAKSQLRIETNLGLNDTGADQLKLKCSEISIDQFAYDKLDEAGFGIKLRTR